MDIVLKDKEMKSFPYIRDTQFLDMCRKKGWTTPARMLKVLDDTIPTCKLCSHRGLGG